MAPKSVKTIWDILNTPVSELIKDKPRNAARYIPAGFGGLISPTLLVQHDDLPVEHNLPVGLLAPTCGRNAGVHRGPVPVVP
jgi:hypothetical protein